MNSPLVVHPTDSQELLGRQRSRISRRMMMMQSAVGFGTALSISGGLAAEPSRRRFKMDLRCGSIGVNADQRRAIDLAHRYGFESVDPDWGTIASMSPAERNALVAELKEKGLVWGAGGLPVEYRRDDATFQNDLKRLPSVAAALQDAGVTRVGTWVSPSHNELNYLQNFRFHADRFRPCAKILKDHGIRFGLEYIGPKTLWTAKRHPFIHTMAETKELFEAIGVDNMGFILDSWHWYTAHETVEDLRTLTNDDIVACDLNDAPSGVPIDQQIDSRRELPLATGVIDLKGFLSELVRIGYDGPVRAEPFNQALNAMDDEAAVAATAKAMKAAFALVGG